MATAIWWFGYICAGLLAVVVTVGLVTAIIAAGSAVCNSWYQAGVSAGIEQARQQIRTDAWWFSEDRPTLDLLMAFGAGGGFDVSHTRERWRKARESATKGQP